MSSKKVQRLRLPATDRLEGYLARLRQLAGEGERNQVSLMELLMELFEHKELWEPRYTAWDDLLREEGFATAHAYEGFVKAFNELGREEVSRLGVKASISLVRLPKATRGKVHNMLNQWLETHQVPPTYQRVATYVKLTVGSLNKPKGQRSKDEQLVSLRATKRDLSAQNRALSAANERLKRHIWKLNGMLKKAKIEPPKMPDLGVEA